MREMEVLPHLPLFLGFPVLGFASCPGLDWQPKSYRGFAQAAHPPSGPHRPARVRASRALRTSPCTDMHVRALPSPWTNTDYTSFSFQ